MVTNVNKVVLSVLDSAPLEPPVIEASATVGEEDMPVKLFLSAYSSSTSTESSSAPSELSLELHGLPSGASLNKGSADPAGMVTITEADFGDGFELVMPKDLSGDFEFSLLAREVRGSQRSERAGVLIIEVQGRADKPILRVAEVCFVPSSEVQLVPLTILEARSTDRDDSETLMLVVDNLPFSVSIMDQYGAVMLQKAEFKDWSGINLQIGPDVLEEFQVTITLVVNDDGDETETTVNLKVGKCEVTTTTTTAGEDESTTTAEKDNGGGKTSGGCLPKSNMLFLLASMVLWVAAFYLF